MRRIFLTMVIIVLFISFESRGENNTNNKTQNSTVTEQIYLRTPQQCGNHLFTYLNAGNYRPEVAAKCLDLSAVDKKDGAALAVKLLQIYDGLGFEVPTNLFPNDPDYTDSTRTGKSVFVLERASDNVPELIKNKVVIEKVDGKWLYSAEFVSRINDLHKKVYPFGTHRILNMVPKFGHYQFLGLDLWQYTGILILIVMAFILHKVLTILIGKILSKLMLRFGQLRMAGEPIIAVSKPLSLLVIFVLLSIFVPVLQLPIVFGKYVIILLKASVPLFTMLMAYKMVDVLGIYLMKMAERTENTLDDQLVPLLRKALKTFVVIIGIVFILQNLQFNVMALITGISIGGLAIAFAAQDTIKNFFGSIMIFIDRPFQVGDWVVTDGIDGDIEEVGFRSTRVRTFHNSIVYIPNGKFADMTIDNMGKRKYRRYKTYLGVTYDTPPHLIEGFIDGIEKIVLNHPKTRKDYYNIFLNNFAASSLEVLLYIFFEVPNWTEELRVRQEINLEIIKLADKLGVRFAFPTQTLHIEDFPEKKSLTPDSYLTEEDIRKEMEQFGAGKS